MAWISASWRYILSTPLAMGGGEVLMGLPAATLVRPPSWLAEGVTPLARAWVELKNTIMMGEARHRFTGLPHTRG
jgi:hypothetical protein